MSVVRRPIPPRSRSAARRTVCGVGALNDLERDCLQRFCELVRERLGDQLVEVGMYGSAARGDMWPARSPMHSDIDLLVITREPVVDDRQEELLNETYPFYLECGRQLSPHFFSERRLAEPEDERTREFLERVAGDIVPVWPTGLPPRR
jgi:predicted nucleotidyltransferase